MAPIKPADPESTAPASPLAMVREGRYLGVLLALLMSATVFEGYDVTIFHLCTPDIRARSISTIVRSA